MNREELRTIRAARDLLLEDAEAIHQGHTLDGEWGGEVDAKALYDRTMEVAEKLRLIAVAYRVRKTTPGKSST